MGEIGDGIVVGRGSIAVETTDLEYEDIASGTACQRIVAAIADQDVVAAPPVQRIVAAIADKNVVEFRAGHGVDTASNRVVSDRDVAVGSSRTICTKRHDDTAGRMVVCDASIAVAGNCIVAAAAFDLVEGGSVALPPRPSAIRAPSPHPL